MRILVAGGAGFIGSNFIHHLLRREKNIRVLNYDQLTYAGNLDNLRDIEKDRRYGFVRGNIGDQKHLNNIFKKFRPDYIINFAAETHVDRSIHLGAKEFVDSNIIGVFNFLEAIKVHPNVKKYVQVSTDEVYGSLTLKAKVRFKENTVFAPNSPYAAAKASGDLLCRAYYKTFKLPVVVTHCSNNYGPYQYPETLIPFFITRIMAGEKLPLYGDGRNVRDWIYVLDHCEALRLCLFKGRAGEVYNIGADSELNNLTIAGLLLKYFGLGRDRLRFVADRPGHDRRYAVDSSKIRKELGWRPQYSFQKAFTQTIEWYLDNRVWLERIEKKVKAFNPHIDFGIKSKRKNKNG